MESKPLLMFDHGSKSLIPINENIFQISQFLNEKKLNEKYKGNLILYPSGELKVIDKVEITGYFGNSFFSKLFSILNKTNTIAVSLSSSEDSIEYVVGKAENYLKNDQSGNDSYLPRQESDLIKANQIRSFLDLYNAIALPDSEDCLDVMV